MIWIIQVLINLSLLKLTITWQLYTRLVQFYPQNLIFLHSRKCVMFKEVKGVNKFSMNVQILIRLILLTNNSLCSEKDLPFTQRCPFLFVEYLSTGKSPLEICSGFIERIRFILTYAIRKQVGWIKTKLISYEL